MEIIFLINNIQLGGGGERVCINLANAFSTKGYNIRIISISGEKSNNILFNLDTKVNVEYFNINSKKNKLLSKLKAIYLLNKKLKRSEKSLILGIGTYPSILIGLIINKGQIKTVGCMHGSYSALSLFWRTLTKMIFPKLNVIVSLTLHDEKILKSINKNVRVIHNSTQYLRGEKALLINKNILALGRLSDEKDFFTMIDIFGKFNEEEQDWTLTIRGAGPLEEKLISYLNKKELSEKIFLLPPTQHVEKEFLNSSMLLLTSKNEGFPMAIVEAQTFGVPVISYDCLTGPSEIIKDSLNGFLVKPGDKSTFIDKMKLLSRNIQLRKEIGNAAYEHSILFQESEVLNKWFKLLIEINN